MKRLTILTIIVAGGVALCLGQSAERQYRPRVQTRGSPIKVVQLTDPRQKGPVSLEEALTRQQSSRQFTGQPLKLTDVGQLAWAGQGITEPQKGLQTTQSAGTTYPIELYFATQDGLFVYRPQGHSLEQIFEQDIRKMLATTALVQETAAQAGCDIIVVGSARKLAAQLRDDARKYMLLEAGHIAQNIQLQAVCLDLGYATVESFDTKEVIRICRLTRELEPIYIICVGYPATEKTTEEASQQNEAARMQPSITGGGKRAVLIAAGVNFQDEELFATQRALNTAGVETVIASTILGPIRGMQGGVAEARILMNQLRVDDFDAIIFIGGSGAAEYFNNPAALNITREAARRRKVIAATSTAPTVLANAGVLTGIRATSFLSEQAKLIQAGAIYTGTPVERDRLIITASSPSAAAIFSQAIVDTLAGR